MIFVLDSSVSQTEKEFRTQLDFVNNFIDHLIIGENDTQVAVITYSFEANVEIELGQYNSNETLKDAVRSIKFR